MTGVTTVEGIMEAQDIARCTYVMLAPQCMLLLHAVAPVASCPCAVIRLFVCSAALLPPPPRPPVRCGVCESAWCEDHLPAGHDILGDWPLFQVSQIVLLRQTQHHMCSGTAAL